MCDDVPEDKSSGNIGKLFGKSKESVLCIKAENPIVKIISPLTTALRARTDVGSDIKAVVETVASSQCEAEVDIIETTPCWIITEIIIIFEGESGIVAPTVCRSVISSKGYSGSNVGRVHDIIGGFVVTPDRGSQAGFGTRLVAHAHPICPGAITLTR